MCEEGPPGEPSKERKTSAYQPDARLQGVLRGLNDALADLERDLVASLEDVDRPPVLFLAYLPRAGSTLLAQLMARTGRFNYVSNFQSRFWRAPYVGGVLERSLSVREIYPIPLESNYGLTEGPAAPSEFSYFWRHWLGFTQGEPHTLSAERWAEVDAAGLRAEIDAIRSLRPGALFFKKEWLGLNARWLLEELPEARLVYLTRNPCYVAQSVLTAREDVWGDPEHWWAARPERWPELEDRDPSGQIAGQIRDIDHTIRSAGRAHPDRFQMLQYEELIEDIHGTLDRLATFAGMDALGPNALSRVPEKLKPKRSSRRTAAEVERLEAALEREGML